MMPDVLFVFRVEEPIAYQTTDEAFILEKVGACETCTSAILDSYRLMLQQHGGHLKHVAIAKVEENLLRQWKWQATA
jgi:Fe-S cluster biogenesis protein NfuA